MEERIKELLDIRGREAESIIQTGEMTYKVEFLDGEYEKDLNALLDLEGTIFERVNFEDFDDNGIVIVTFA